MSIKRLLLVPVLVSATAGPYLVMDDGWKQWASEQAQGAFGSSQAETWDPLVALPSPGGGFPPPGNTAGDASVPITITDLREALRFNVTPAWVLQRWPRVSTVRAADDLSGLRVPLVTGTRVDDLSGSLTYYFNRDQQVQRLSFHGYTGDATRLIQLASQHLNLQPEPSAGGMMYVQRWNGQPTSVLRVSHSPLVQAHNPHSRLIVQLEVNRPGAYFQLSPEFQQLLQYDSHTGRW